jgi:hypothetical protein
MTAEWPAQSLGISHRQLGSVYLCELIHGERRKVRNRRIFLVAASSGEGLLTERRTAAQLWRRELAFMPPS